MTLAYGAEWVGRVDTHLNKKTKHGKSTNKQSVCFSTTQS